LGIAPTRARLFFCAAVLASLCAANGGSAASRVDGLTINVFYTGTSLEAKLSNGTALSTGAVVPPGPYSVVVYDSGDDANPRFTMTGPGASISSDLNPDGSGIQVPVTFGPFVLEPSASYAIFDANMAGGQQITFTTSATGSSASSSGSSAHAAKSAHSGAKTLGTLTLSLGTAGRPILLLAAVPVTKLKAGRYSLIVGDKSKKAGLLIGRGKRRPARVSGTKAVGTHTRFLTLTVGKWFYEASKHGPKTYFEVTKSGAAKR